MIVVLAKPLDAATPIEQLTNWYRQKLPLYMVPHRIEWREALPRNPNGKIDRVTVRARSPTTNTRRPMSNLPLHTTIEGFDVRDNCLCVAGRKITDIVREAGRTPLYVYDSSLIEARVKKLRSLLPDGVKIHYAMKANPHRDVVQLLSSLVDGLDVASAGELERRARTQTRRVPKSVSLGQANARSKSMPP